MNKIQYKLNIPEELYEQLKTMSKQKSTTVADLLRRGIKWELLANSVYNDGGHISVVEKRGEASVRIKPL